MTRIMNLLNLAPDIQEEILFLPARIQDRENLRPLTRIVSWEPQRKWWRQLSVEGQLLPATRATPIESARHPFRASHSSRE
jgi:hypothetical protein